VSPVELPTDRYFANVKELFEKLEGIDTLLENPKLTSVRLVTNPEKMVLRETQRAFVYFSLHGLTVDWIIANRVLPDQVNDNYFAEWRLIQAEILDEMDRYFAPVKVKGAVVLAGSAGQAELEELAAALYPDGEDPRWPPTSNVLTASARWMAITKYGSSCRSHPKARSGSSKRG
jgi:arsenite-transporting ATPase